MYSLGLSIRCVAIPKAMASAAFICAPVAPKNSAWCTGNCFIKRLAPASGNKPIVTSGIDIFDVGVTNRTEQADKIPNPPPITIP